MKKFSTTKLALHTQTIRQLDAITLATVHGGEIRTTPAVCVQLTEDCGSLYLKPTIVKP
jgi:hypothetical protein